MSRPEMKKPSIPSWQQQLPSQQPEPDSSTRKDRLEQAAKFLRDESIRDAPTDRKIEFLESKGLNNEEIQGLLGISRNTEASSTFTEKDDSPTTGSEAAESSSASQLAVQNDSETKEESLTSSPEALSTSTSSTTTTSPSLSPSPSNPSSAPRDIPPIITYPEFLFEPTKSPPLLSLRNIFYILYSAAGLGTTIYGTSEYVVKPMLANLTTARHELATTAMENLKKLNEKLEQNVSTISPRAGASRAADDGAESEDSGESDNANSITSDPTELFHRDVATQTSPDLDVAAANASASPPSLSSGSDDGLRKPSSPSDVVTVHAKRLDGIKACLRELAEADKSSNNADQTVQRKLGDLQQFLSGLSYAGSSSAYSVGYSGYGASGLGDSHGSGGDGASPPGIGKGEELAISAFRAEIRGVKGALLSARNFPSVTGTRTVGGMSAGR